MWRRPESGELRPGCGVSFSCCSMVCSSAYAGFAFSFGTAARAADSVSGSSRQSSRAAKKCCQVLSACMAILLSVTGSLHAVVFVLAAVAVVDGGVPCQPVAVVVALRRQIVRLAIVIAMHPV